MKYVKRFRVAPGTEVKLKDIDPGFKDHHESHKDAAEEIERDRKKLCEQQELLYADGRCSLLICLQGMDTGARTGWMSRSGVTWILHSAGEERAARLWRDFRLPERSGIEHLGSWLGDRRPEEELGRIGGGWVEGLADGVTSVVELLVDELAADLMEIGQGSDRVAGECLAGHLLPCHRRPQSCVGGKDRCGGL